MKPRLRRFGGRLRPAFALPLVIAGVVGLGADGVRAAERTTARRVLVFSLPNVSWADLGRQPLPNLDQFLDRAAVAGLSTRSDVRSTTLADGYATIGAGTRSVGVPGTEGDGLMADERFGIGTAGDVYTQRTGQQPRGAIVNVGIVPITDANERLHYDSEVGALADALHRAGLEVGVVANADGEEPDAARTDLDASPGPARQRQAVLGLMDSDGQVSRGQVDPSLLIQDPTSPFGVRLDQSAVVAAFDRAWTGRSAVLVEASDLARADRYRPYVNAEERARQQRDALRRSDQLFGEILDGVDLDSDLVIVVGPAHSSEGVTLTPLAIRGPGYAPGLLESPTTRRDGFVQIQDIAPTILHGVGADAPTSMEGRPAEVGGTGGSAADRRDFIETADAAAQFRDSRIGEVYGLLVAASAIGVGLVFLAFGFPSMRTWRALCAFAALATLGLILAVFLARLFPLHESGVGAYYGFLIAVSLALGALYTIVGAVGDRRQPLDGLIVALLAIVALLTVDALRGAPLVLNSTLGYSPTVAGRFAGFGNPTYAAYAAAALLGAVLLAHRLGGRRGFWWAAGILGLAVVIDVAPMWGSDVGGILSMVPAYGVTLVMLRGARVRVRTVIVGVGVVAAVGIAAALVDFARPADQRTHLGRLIERVRDNGPGEGWSVIQRKLDDNVATLATSILGLMLLVAAVLFVGLWFWKRDRLRAVLAEYPGWWAACVGFFVLAVLGFALNDSGVTVPGIMLVVFVAAWARLLVLTESLDRVPSAPARRAESADI